MKQIKKQILHAGGHLVCGEIIGIFSDSKELNLLEIEHYRHTEMEMTWVFSIPLGDLFI